MKKHLIFPLLLLVLLFAACSRTSPLPIETPDTPRETTPIETPEETPTETPNTPIEPILPMPTSPELITEESPIVSIPLNEVRYTTSDLNLRAGPGREHEILAVLRKGAMVTVIDELSNGWAFIRDGYVSMHYLTEEVPEVIPTGTTYVPMTLYLPGRAVPYMNGGVSKGQQIIDDNPHYASTWGGATPWSGEDGENTHFIAHDYGAFNGIWDMPLGSRIIVTDNKGVPVHYLLEKMFLVDRFGVRVEDGEERFEFITGRAGGEVITLQTCEPDSDHNWILRAVAAH